jgi:hypothetical protein
MKPAAPDAGAPAGLTQVTAVGPRLLSNQTSNPLTVVGSGFKGEMTLEVGGKPVKLVVLDAHHAYGRLPGGIAIPKDQIQALVDVSLDGKPTGQKLKIVNDTSFPVLTGLAVSGRTAWVASLTEDRVYAIDLDTKVVTPYPVGDGPMALAAWRDGVVVGHRFSADLLVVSPDGGSSAMQGHTHASALLVDGDTLYMAEQATDSVCARKLDGAGREQWCTPVAPNPGALALTSRGLAVGSQQTGEIEWLDPTTGQPLFSVAPGPGTPILGPPTIGGDGPAMSEYVMNGSMPRALAFSRRDGKLFSASIGPNIGPNPKKMEVAMNGGVAALDVPKGDGTPRYLRHLGTGGGVTQALALDEARGLLYGADVALGLVRVFDVKKLAGSATDAERAVLQEVAIEPPADFPLIRPREDFAVKGRAGVALHSGPSALQLSSDHHTLYVLDRFTGTLARLDVKGADQRQARVIDQLPIANMLAQASRRRGEVLYFTDLGRTAVTCDACHPDGHTGGLMFEKTSPLRIYRTNTVRGSLETAPYFTPASTFSIGQTAKFVMDRNRYSNPTPTVEELEDLTRYTSAVTTLPNPFADELGALPMQLALPDGHLSHPRKGLLLFEGKAGCSGCHPAPHFTTDQDNETRGKYLDVGTPHLMPLREDLQDPLFRGFGVPALVGSWDVFPMLSTGGAGLKAQENRLVVETRFPLRKAVSGFAPKHGRADLLSPEELDDLLGYVQSL